MKDIYLLNKNEISVVSGHGILGLVGAIAGITYPYRTYNNESLLEFAFKTGLFYFIGASFGSFLDGLIIGFFFDVASTTQTEKTVAKETSQPKLIPLKKMSS